jgi:hypothetical protein
VRAKLAHYAEGNARELQRHRMADVPDAERRRFVSGERILNSIIDRLLTLAPFAQNAGTDVTNFPPFNIAVIAGENDENL